MTEEKWIRRVLQPLFILFFLIAITLISCQKTNKNEIKDPLDIVDLSMEGDAVLESTTEFPSGLNMDIYYHRGHEYMTVYTSHYQNMSQSVSTPVHLTASCIGCNLEREGFKFKNMILRFDKHQYEFRTIENIRKDSVISMRIKHYNECDMCKKLRNYEQK